MRELDNNPKECLKKVILILNELKAVKVVAPCTILASPCTMSPAPCHFSHTTEDIIHECLLASYMIGQDDDPNYKTQVRFPFQWLSQRLEMLDYLALLLDTEHISFL